MEFTEGEEGKAYAVSSIDALGNLSAPVGTGQYTGYIDTLESAKRGQQNDFNRNPIAIITVSPSTAVKDDTNVSFSYENSFDPDDDEIVNVEWTVDGIVTSNPNGTYSVGEHAIKLRVQDSKGNWSDYAETTLYVRPSNYPPTAVITVTPTEGITNYTNVTFDYSQSSDPDFEDYITNAEWEVDGVIVSNPNGTYPVGTHTIRLRVQDSKGLWSEWVETQIHVAVGNLPPVPVITINPAGVKDPSTNIAFSYASSTDPDGDGIVEAQWEVDGNVVSNPNGTYSGGNHTVRLKVKDERGMWSDWSEPVTFSVNHPPVTPTITITSSNGFYREDATLTFTASFNDPNGDTHSATEWRVNGSTVANPNGKYNAGSYTIEARVKDSKGTWSSWGSKTLVVEKKPNSSPTVTGIYLPSTLESNIVITPSVYYNDPDGDSIVAQQWKIDSSSTVYNLILRHLKPILHVRVQDSNGAWSDWYSKTFYVYPIDGTPFPSSAFNYSRFVITILPQYWQYSYYEKYNFIMILNGTRYTGNNTNPYYGNYGFEVPKSVKFNKPPTITLEIYSKASNVLVYTRVFTPRATEFMC